MLERLAICTLGGAMRDAFVDFKRVRVQRLHRATCLVAEVQRAFVGPLWRAFDAAIKTESFTLGIDDLETTETTICHSVKRVLPFQDPIRDHRQRVHLPTSSTPRGDPLKWDLCLVAQFLYLVL